MLSVIFLRHLTLHCVDIFKLRCVNAGPANHLVITHRFAFFCSQGGGRKSSVFIFPAHTGVQWVCGHKESFCSCQGARVIPGRARARLRPDPVRSP